MNNRGEAIELLAPVLRSAGVELSWKHKALSKRFDRDVYQASAEVTGKRFIDTF